MIYFNRWLYVFAVNNFWKTIKMISISTFLTIISLLISSGAVGWVFRFSWKTAVWKTQTDEKIKALETAVAEKRVTIKEVKTYQDLMDKRLIRVEEAIVSLSEVVPELRTLGQVSSKLDAIMEVMSKRVELIENTLFNPKSDA